MNQKNILLMAAVALGVATAAESALAQDAVFTYQGLVSDNGTNFTGIGQFEFALVTSSNANHTATATANAPSGGFITGYVVTAGGNGYLTAPAVTVSGGGGSGAAAAAHLTGGTVTSLSVVNTGNGSYTSTPTVVIAPPPPNLSYTTFWSNDGTSANGSEPAVAVSVPVIGGLFTVALGDATQPGMTAIPASLFTQPNLQLQIWFNDGTQGFAVLNPPQNLTQAPYAVAATELLGGFTVQTGNAYGSPNVIGGSSINYVSSGVVGATIAGGGVVDDPYDFIPYTNSVTANFGTVSGGIGNAVTNVAGTIGGGAQNTVGGNCATVVGGILNTASGQDATVAGGVQNVASGYASFAAGSNANAKNNNSFVWSDGSDFSSSTNDQFAVHAYGGVLLAADVQIDTSTYHNLSLTGGNSIGYLYGSYPKWGDGIHLDYNYYADASGNDHIPNTGGATSRLSVGYGTISLNVSLLANSPPTTQRLLANATGVTVNGTFNNSSDRNAKQDFAPVNSAQMLDKVARLPLSEWSYKEDPKTRHVGPMGQDFYAAFNIGTDEKHIAPIDEGGVALAAIQGLNQKVEAENAELRAENAELKQANQDMEKKLDALQTLIQTALKQP